MNMTILIGRLVHDPELKYTTDQKPICRIRLAVDRYNDATDFITCVAFQKNAELIEKYLHKGSQCAIQGNIKTRSYEKDGKKVYTTEVYIDRVQFLDGKKDFTPTDEDDPFGDLF